MIEEEGFGDAGEAAKRSAGKGFLVTACGRLDAQPVQSARVRRPPRHLQGVGVKVVEVVARGPRAERIKIASAPAVGALVL